MEGELEYMSGDTAEDAPAEVVSAEPSPSPSPTAKPNQRRYRSYNAEDLHRAFHAVRENGMSLRQAAQQFNIPKSTLADRLGSHRPKPPPLNSLQPGGRWTEEDVTKAMLAIEAGTGVSQAAQQFGVPRTVLHSRARGRKPRPRKNTTAKLTMKEEMLVAQWAGAQCDLGFPPSTDDIYNLANKVMQKKHGADRSLGKRWVANWLQRNPQIKMPSAAEDVEPQEPPFTIATFETPTQEFTDNAGNWANIANTPII